MEKNDCDFGNYSPPIRFIAYSSLILTVFVILFYLIQDIQENQSVTNNLSATAISVVSKPKDTNVSNKITLPFPQNNILNFTQIANENND